MLLKQVRPKWPWKCPTAVWRWEQPVSCLQSALKMISLACCFRWDLQALFCLISLLHYFYLLNWNFLDNTKLKYNSLWDKCQSFITNSFKSKQKVIPFIYSMLLLSHFVVKLTCFCFLSPDIPLKGGASLARPPAQPALSGLAAGPG